MRVNLSYYALIREIHSYSTMLDVGIELVRVKDDETYIPRASQDMRTKKRTLHLIQPEASWDAERILKWRGDFYHELGHFAPEVMDYYQLLQDKELNATLDENNHMPMFVAGMNALEDYRQEHNNLGAYQGRDETLSKSHAMAVQDILDNVGDKFNELDGKGDISIYTALLWLTSEARASWQRDVSGQAEVLKSRLRGTMLEKIELLQSEGIVERLEEVETAEQEYELWKDILKLFERDPDEEEKQAQAQNQSGEGAGEESEAGEGESGGGNSDTDGDAKARLQKGNGDSDSEERNREDAEISWEDLQTHEHDSKPEASYHNLEISYRGYNGHNENFPVAEKINVHDYVNNKNVGGYFRSPDSSYMSATAHANTHTGLANKIRKLLQVKTQTLTVNGQKKGRLATRSMHRVAMAGGGAYRERVFKKKIQQFDLDTAVTVLVDFSGSMGGGKMEHAITSAIMLNESISKLGVPLEILGFTDESESSEMSVFKVFDRKITNEKLRHNMCRGTNMMGGNSDGESILWAYHRLAKQKNKRKLLIVLSDGQPASGRGMCVEFTKDVIKQIEAEKRAEIYGIGIKSNSVKHFYKHNAVIHHSNELESAVITVIKNHILR